MGLLLAACGSEGGESPSGGETDGVPGEAPPVATATPTATVQVPTDSDWRDRLDEMILGEDDVPAGLSSMGSMGLDYDLKTLGVVGPQGGKAEMAVFAGPDQREIVVSMVILLDDASAVEEALGQIDNLTLDQIRDALNMAGNFGGIKLLDSHQLDVSGLGETAAGFGLTMELPQVGVGDGQWVFFGRDSLLAMVMTMAMGGGTPADAVRLAEVMDAKIRGMLQ
jgi:hypothetical protein